ncbi:transmembrane channel-like protein 7 isoform X1 [Haliotis cracherodii]|uniref:transmembrane channel-like protein 7 isoform X1 n=1 Tax=Haliotis cracherodii TaxID=6455 RepID=UPI0039E9F04C
MDEYRGRSRGHTRSNPTPYDWDNVAPDYEDNASPRQSPERGPSWTSPSQQPPGAYTRGGSRQSGRDMDRGNRSELGPGGYRSAMEDMNRGGVNAGYRSSDDNIPYGRDRSDVERGYSPARQHSRQGSGGYDNQGFPDGPQVYAIDDYERERYMEQRGRSPEITRNEAFQMSDNGTSPDVVSNSSHHPQLGRYSDEVDGRYIQHHGRHYRTDNDNHSVYSLNLGEFAMGENVWDKLHTIRLRRKSQKSRKSAMTLSRRRRGLDEGEKDGDDDEDREGLLPSLQARVKQKSLHERYMDKVQSTTDAAEAMRDTAALQAGGVSSVKQSIKQSWRKKRSQLKGWLYQLELWASTFKEIEGRFGTATVSYFRFTRWLMFLNLYIFLLMFCVIVIPYFALPTPDLFHNIPTVNRSDTYFQEADRCTTLYKDYIDNLTARESVGDMVLDFIQGTGWMERKELFYGVYYNRTYPLPDNKHGTYNMSLAYLLTTGICFLLSFILIVKNSGKSVKEAVVDQESSKSLYCNKVFCAWDFCISNEKTAGSKMASFTRELEDDLNEERRRNRQAERSTGEKCRLIFVRIFINLFVICILGASLYLIYYTTETLLELDKTGQAEFVVLIYQYLPSLAITVLNFLVPLMFSKVVIVEDYSSSFELKITLFRTVLLRLASLGVLIISLYIQLLGGGDNKMDSTCGNKRWSAANGSDDTSTSIKCWETYVGQQFYKLALLDFVTVVLLTFLVEFPRRVVVQKLSKRFKLIKLIGEQEFDLPKNVLDIVYSQTLCWLGMFFSPLIPAMTLMKVLVIFYVKRLTVLNNCIPALRPYRASRSHSFFMTVLLFSFVLSVIPLGYLIGTVHPSQSCGPFRLYSHEDYVIFDTITNTVRTWPSVARDIFSYLGTVGFFVPAIILLCLLMYYYWAVSQGYKKMEQLLKEQLKMEGRDRQFLLTRVNEVIQRGELGTAVTG